MRKLIVCNIMSLDGYFEGPDKNVMNLFEYRMKEYPEDESFDAYNAERLRLADTVLMGRTMYDQSKGYWPSLADDPNAPPIEQEISRLLNAIDKVVISDSLTPDETQPWHQNTRIIRRADAHGQIAELKRQTGKDIVVFGSRTLWNDLLANDLVDELHQMIGPVVVGAGTPVFDGQPPVSLRLIDTCTWDGSGVVLIRYEIHQKT
jgi:dihydrofolate reductase